ncbi:MAG TPA: GNAT family N-acetyltransferase [Candidatus Dormibacteraeota bacterium]|jgi:GNAT superfamily N-acetyltransferase|nr:GNAT family N-acetyltransferase [Candidatus Dormibacteraeota bacterium]
MLFSMVDVILRRALDTDAEAMIDLIARVFAEYDGVVLDTETEWPHLHRPASTFADWGGVLWVAEAGDALVACAGYSAHGEEVEMHHLYVDAAHRRNGIAARLCDVIEEDARRRRFRRVSLWSDTRFLDAHRFYERRGYRSTGRTRDLNDISNTTEHGFEKDLVGTC